MPKNPQGHRGLAEILTYLIEMQIVDEKDHYADNLPANQQRGITGQLKKIFRAKYYELKEIKQLLFTCST
jgi:hypothetical protein